MPWAERIEEVPAEGETIVLVDNSEVIDAELAAWNETTDVEIPEDTGANASASTSTSASTSASASGSDGSQNASAGGTQNGSGGSAGGDGEDGSGGTQSEPKGSDDDEGCSCALPGQARPGPAGVIALLGLAVLARRRRSR
jgi:MYXO-CTERM domain-containing protein